MLRMNAVRSSYISLTLFVLIVTGCSSNQAAIQVQRGRTALLIGDPASALTHFNQAAQENSNYVSDSSPLRQGVLTYVGRSHYALGNLPEARKALTQSVERDQSDFMARLYLGLTLLRLPRTPAKANNAFSVADVTFALKERVSPKRIAALVKERGVNFALTGGIERELRKLGADNDLIYQVRTSAEARKKAEPDPRLQGVREAERAFKEMQKWLDEISQTPSGRFWDPGENIRSEIGKNLALIASKKPNLGQLISGGEWVGKAMEEEPDLVRRDEREELRRQRR